MVGSWCGSAINTGKLNFSNSQLKGQVQDSLVNPALVWDGRKGCNLEVWMWFIADIHPLDNSC